MLYEEEEEKPQAVELFISYESMSFSHLQRMSKSSNMNFTPECHVYPK